MPIFIWDNPRRFETEPEWKHRGHAQENHNLVCKNRRYELEPLIFYHTKNMRNRTFFADPCIWWILEQGCVVKENLRFYKTPIFFPQFSKFVFGIYPPNSNTDNLNPKHTCKIIYFVLLVIYLQVKKSFFIGLNSVWSTEYPYKNGHLVKYSFLALTFLLPSSHASFFSEPSLMLFVFFSPIPHLFLLLHPLHRYLWLLQGGSWDL